MIRFGVSGICDCCFITGGDGLDIGTMGGDSSSELSEWAEPVNGGTLSARRPTYLSLMQKRHRKYDISMRKPECGWTKGPHHRLGWSV